MVIREEDRNKLGQMLPEIREKALESLAEYIKARGYVNINEISRKINLARQTVEIMVGEIVDEWAKDEAYQLNAQLKWYEKQLNEVDEHPETFGVKTPREAIQIKASIFKEMNALRSLKDGVKTAKVFNAAISLWNSNLRPRTRRILEERYAGTPETVRTD